MKELSLNILDIAQNSVKAKAENILIKIVEAQNTLSLTITDDGCGIAASQSGSTSVQVIAMPLPISHSATCP